MGSRGPFGTLEFTGDAYPVDRLHPVLHGVWGGSGATH
jgi:hypothetical protein